MKTDTLFPDLPVNRTKLDVWKERHGIWTHDSKAPDDPWMACAAKAFIQQYKVEDEEATDLPTLCSHWCRIIDECGYDAYGATEEDACFALAQKRNIAWLESITQADCELITP